MRVRMRLRVRVSVRVRVHVRAKLCVRACRVLAPARVCMGVACQGSNNIRDGSICLP